MIFYTLYLSYSQQIPCAEPSEVIAIVFTRNDWLQGLSATDRAEENWKVMRHVCFSWDFVDHKKNIARRTALLFTQLQIVQTVVEMLVHSCI